jgi:hypothetical protein
MWTRNRVGIGLSQRPARRPRLAKLILSSILGLLKKFKKSVSVCCCQLGESEKEYVLIQPNQGIVFPSVTYVRNLITKAGTKQVTGLVFSFLSFVCQLHCNENAIYVNPEKELRSLSPNFQPNSCVCERFIYWTSSLIFLQQNRQTALQM